MYWNDFKTQIKEILQRHEGRDRAITARGLSDITGQPDRRVRLVIRELIKEGMPILSSTESPAGYFLPSNWHELNECAASLRGRLIEDAKRRRDLLRAGALYLKPAEQRKLL